MIPARTLQEVALDNAVEGCINETFAASRAMIQAQTAANPIVRRELAQIARDEVEHAELSWEFAAWLSERLGNAQRRSIRRAMREALVRLSMEVALSRDAAATIGLPDDRASRVLRATLRTMLDRRVEAATESFAAAV